MTACKRNAGREDLQDPNASLLVVQATIDDAENVDLNSPFDAKGNIERSTRLSGKSDLTNFENSANYIEGDGFDVITSVSSSWKGQEMNGTPALANSSETLPRATSPMTAGFKYRLVLYKVVGGTQTFWRQKQLTSSASNVVDTTQQIEVVRGDSYQWYAYSYNNANDIPPIATTGSNPAVSMGTNSDFLYATGTFTILPTGAANTPLAINFRHQVARLAVEIDARGMFADNITQLGITVGGIAGGSSPLTTGTFNLATAQVSNPTAYTPTTTFTVANFQNVDAGFNDRKAIYFYSATEASFPALSVNLTGVTITMTDGNTTRAFTGLNRSFSFNTSGAMTAGRTYNAKIDLIESPLTVAGSTVRWARTNLYLNPSERNRYRFYATYAHTNARESYWSFRGDIPTMFGVTGDPCTSVHPTSRPEDGLSVWRQATVADFNTLGTSGLLGSTGPSQSVVYNTVGGLGYYEYAASGTGSPQFPSSNLRFNMNGSGTAVGLVAGAVTINIGITGYGTEARVWTQDRLLDVGGLLGLGAYSFRATRVPAVPLVTSAYNSIVPNVLETLSLGVLGAGLLESPFLNVRCVRR
ncbi:fimbrillin family protein [Sphingobacterium chungjuense]|uniref:fimbrillin family protein n=1 Tax=Sphingobacterium chungjuense TaxID=2675553 RepID=UPI00140ABD24|nr:fimbrillin family protein [Sphingobacterium chungjuense]